MVVEDQGHDGVHLAERLEHLGADRDVVPDLLDFLVGQFPFSIEKAVRDPDLADVVKHRGEIELVLLLGREPELFGDEQ